VIRRRAERLLDKPPAVLLPLLILLSLLYRAAAFLHRQFYRTGLIRRKKLPKPVISVGNLVVGGGGKTPVVMWLAGELVSRGLRPAVLSRGYGRRSRRTVLVGPEDHWTLCGDEPLLIARGLEVPVAVSADRYGAGMMVLEDHDVDLFIMDDGFQHRALFRDLDIVVVDGQRRFGSGRLLPAGVLREPVSRLRDADFILVTKAQAPDRQFDKELTRFKDLPVVWSDFRPAGLLPVSPTTGSGEGGIPPGSALGFCGVAYPEGFRHSLARAGIEVGEFLTFPDHHPYSAEDVSRIEAAAREARVAYMVTTAKDAVRWPDDHAGTPLYYLCAETVPLEGEGKLIAMAQALLPPKGREN
jgi:tetraacyldisaccharide 4'-kinase